MNVNLNNIGAAGIATASATQGYGNAERAQAKSVGADLRFSGVQSYDVLTDSEPVSEIPAGALSRDDTIGKLVSAAFSLPPPPMPAFNV